MYDPQPINLLYSSFLQSSSTDAPIHVVLGI